MATATRLVRGLGASAVLAALLVGVPTLLALAVGWPLPRAVPAWADVRATFAGDLPLDPNTVWKVLACVVWIAWAQIAVAVAVETAALARGGIASPIRGLALMQSLTGPLLSAAALLLPNSVGQTGQPGSAATVPTPAMAHPSPVTRWALMPRSIESRWLLATARTAIVTSSSSETGRSSVPVCCTNLRAMVPRNHSLPSNQGGR